MRATITFEVHAGTHEGLEAAALERYRSYIGKADAQLPQGSHMQVSPHVTTGDGNIIGWSAEVTVQVNNATV